MGFNRLVLAFLIPILGAVSPPLWAPPFESSCTTLMGNETGSSDHGSEVHECRMCGEKCDQMNKQKSIYTAWDFSPSLQDVNVYDVETKIEWTHMGRLREHGDNGIFQAMRFIWATKPDESKGFGGYMGPQIKGRATPDGGQHLFSVWDTHRPNSDGSSVPGRRLAVPASAPGYCQRNCQDCGLHPDLSAAGATSGTQCKLPYDMEQGQAYVYRLRMSSESATSVMDGVTYQGTEWEVTVTDLQQGSVFVLGRVLLQGDTPAQGIKTWKNFHEHLGCTPCDAFYEKTTVTGPWILKPEGLHEVVSGHVEPLDASFSCRNYRVISLTGLSVSIETGPGVSPHANSAVDVAKLFECDDYRLEPPTMSPTPSPTTAPPTMSPTPPPTATVFKMETADVPRGHRCSGGPVGGWGGLGKNVWPNKCKQACLADPLCNFAVYQKNKRRCSSFHSCDSFKKVSGFKVWAKVSGSARRLDSSDDAAAFQKGGIILL